MPIHRDRDQSTASVAVPVASPHAHPLEETHRSTQRALRRLRLRHGVASTRFQSAATAVNSYRPPASDGSPTLRRVSAAGARRVNLVSLLLVICGLGWFGYTVSLPVSPQQRIRAEDAFGIRVERLRLVAGGQFVDFRYRVLDREKASSLLPPSTAAYLMLEKVPVRLSALQVPPAVSGPPTAPGLGDSDVNVAIFGNPGQLVKRGDRVTLVLGPFKVSGLTVQ